MPQNSPPFPATPPQPWWSTDGPWWARPPVGPTAAAPPSEPPATATPSVVGPFDNGPRFGTGQPQGFGFNADPTAQRGHGFNERFPGTFGEFMVGPMATALGFMGPLGAMMSLGRIGMDMVRGRPPHSSIAFGAGPAIARGVDSVLGTGRAARSLGPAPQLDLRGGPMDSQRGRGGFAPGFGAGSKAAQKRGGGRGGGGFGAAESGKGGIGGRY